MLRGFREFIMRGNVVDLAVAVVIGAVVTALVKDLITPLLGAVGGKPNFSRLTFSINKSRFAYGDFINAVIAFVLVAAAIYFFVIMPIKRMTEIQARRRAAGEPAQPAALPSDEVLVLREIRELLSNQQRA